MDAKPFWEETYRNRDVSTFRKGPTADVESYQHLFPVPSLVLDVGCGEGRNSIYLAGLGHSVDAFDLSEAGVEKAKLLAAQAGVSAHFFPCDLAEFSFERDYDVVLSHGVLHLPEKEVRDEFLRRAQEHTRPGGFHVIGIFTNRLPATPDNAPYTHSLFDVGELPEKYVGWEIVAHEEGTFRDTHPGGIHHEHAFERLVAQKR